jgi:hypothetical protein
MMEKPAINPEMHFPEILRWKPWPPWDPVPWWFFDKVNLPREALSQLAIIQLEHEKAMLQQSLKALDQSIEAIRKFGQK